MRAQQRQLRSLTLPPLVGLLPLLLDPLLAPLLLARLPLLQRAVRSRDYASQASGACGRAGGQMGWSCRAPRSSG